MCTEHLSSSYCHEQLDISPKYGLTAKWIEALRNTWLAFKGYLKPNANTRSKMYNACKFAVRIFIAFPQELARSHVITLKYICTVQLNISWCTKWDFKLFSVLKVWLYQPFLKHQHFSQKVNFKSNVCSFVRLSKNIWMTLVRH